MLNREKQITMSLLTPPARQRAWLFVDEILVKPETK